MTWPPPDPDRVPRVHRPFGSGDAFTHSEGFYSNQHAVEAFRRRQQEDLKRFQGTQSQVYKRKVFHDRYASQQAEDDAEDVSEFDSGGSSGGEEGWRNSEGDRLRDFGVEEEVEFYDEDEVPLGQLLRRRKEGKFSVGKT